MTRRRRERLLMLRDLRSGLVALMATWSLWLIPFAILAGSDLTPKARGDSARESHTEAPEFRGVRANAPIPPHMHMRNEGGSDGAGLCVICGVTIAGRYQGVPGVDRLFPIAKTRPGGYSPTKLQALLDEVLPDEKWASYVGTDPAVLDRLSAMGYPIGITMTSGELYGNRRIHHMVTNVHFDSRRDLACHVDNNRPGVYVWTTAREAARRWIDGPTGWAFVWLRRARAAAGRLPRELAAIVAVGLVLLGLGIRRIRAEGDPIEPEELP